MSASITTLQSKVINWLRFPLAVAVVLLHSGESKDGVYGSDFYSTFQIVLSQGICRIAVPCFFFFSGFLFFSGLKEWETRIWLGKIKKRARTLLLPYILWNILALLVGFTYEWFRARFNPDVVPMSLVETIRQNGGLNIFWGSIWGLPMDYPLWFIRDLIVFVAITPLVFYFVKYCRLIGIIALFLVCCFSRDFEGLFFFVFGAWFQISSHDFCAVFSKIKWPAYLICAVGVFLIARTYREHPEAYKYIKYLFVFFGVVSAVNFASFNVVRGLISDNPFLSSSSFFIYASHAILILHDIAHYITLHLLPFEGVLGKCVVMIVNASLAVGICLALFALMKKWTPKTLGVLTGNRA